MKALIVVDMQKDFMPEGPMGVTTASGLIPFINELIPTFPIAVATKDWHPKNHVSFVDNHPHKKVGDRVEGQELWPVHCVQETVGAEFAEGLNTDQFQKVFYKGIDPEIDSYSTFFDNAKKRETGLFNYLKEQNVDEITIVGVATDYCVLYSVLDALELGFKVTVLRKGCKPIDQKKEEEVLAIMRKKGATIK